MYRTSTNIADINFQIQTHKKKFGNQDLFCHMEGYYEKNLKIEIRKYYYFLAWNLDVVINSTRNSNRKGLPEFGG